MLKHFRFALLAFLACALAACSTTPSKLVAPKVELIGIQPLSTDMFAQRFKLRMHLQNPNDLEVAVKRIDYDLILAGDRFATGLAEQPFVLPAKGEAEFDMVVTTDFVSAFGRLVSRYGGRKIENVDYEIAGTIVLDKKAFGKIPFNQKGTLNFGKLLGEPKGVKSI
jgi:LEA14-like dessication related protein